MITAFAPGRVNLIGDHTDYTGGYVLPCAIEFGTTVTLTGTAEAVLALHSESEAVAARIALPVRDPAAVAPDWARYPAAVAAELSLSTGATGVVRTTLPVGAGLSSSAALEVAVALALGFQGTAAELAGLCQRAEQRAVGVPCGVMDQLASVAGIADHALLIDCTALAITPVPFPDDLALIVVDSRQPRALAGSAYAERRAACEAAATELGPLREATLSDVATLADETTRRRARHVVTENERVVEAAAALGVGDAAAAGAAMTASHASLRDDFEVSTPALDALVTKLVNAPGVHGARLTGAGFGGCAVALAERDRAAAVAEQFSGWVVRPSVGAAVIEAGSP